jgi:cytidylate kinase
MSASPAILISGFTAAGKTTHARLLAEDLGWAYLGLSGIRRELLGPGWATEPSGAEWEPAMDRLRGSDPGLDVTADRVMAQRIAAVRDPVVVDAWLQPWLSGRASAVRVWLGSDEQSRLRKASVTFLRRGMQPPDGLDQEVRQKDRFSVEQFRSLYGIRFGPDADLFDVLIDNSGYIPAASILASDEGIEAFRPVFRSAVTSLLLRKAS